MRESALAKINLFLHVGARRADGFHELESLVVFADTGDALSFEAADVLSLAIDGPFAAQLRNVPDNLVLKAAHALQARVKRAPGARITLTKNLPVASGLGGGSADAAAALRGLAKLWNLDLPQSALAEIAASLGSDVPVCLLSKPAWMTGRGEIVSAVELAVRAPIVLVNPGVEVSTATVFERLDARCGIGNAPKPSNIRTIRALCDYLQDTFNDLEAPARKLAPMIGEVLAALTGNGALLARMSGSGATCFGIFESDGAADEAAKSISKAHPDWWAKATAFNIPG